MTNATKLDQFFSREINAELKDVLISCDRFGKYSLFGKYTISPTSDDYYKVTISGSESSYEFASLKHALTWCVFSNSSKQREANKIQLLDMKLCGIDVDLAVHRRKLKLASDAFTKDIYIIKVQEDTIKRKLIVAEINSYINNSRQIQVKKFTSKNKMNFKYL